MHFTSSASLKQRKNLDVIVLPVWQEKKGGALASEAKEFSALVSLPLDSGDFRGKEGEILLLYPSKGPEKKVLLLGLGSREKCTEESLRRAYASATKALHKKNKSMNVLLPECEHLDSDSICKAICEGVLLSHYTFDILKGEAAKEEAHTRPILDKICMIGGGKKCLEICDKAATIISSVNFARDLVNGNADDVTPERLASALMFLLKNNNSIEEI